MVENGDNNRRRHIHSMSGYSLVEILIVLCLVAIVSAMAIPVSSYFVSSGKADSAIIAALNAIDTARDRAVAERRNFELTFIMPDKIRLERIEVPSGLKTLISETVLENNQQFVKFGTVPDTPDAFGAGSAFYFSGTPPVMFTSDGSLIDANGDVVNGTVFLGMPGQVDTARAVTVFGMTGLTRTWKWRGAKWME